MATPGVGNKPIVNPTIPNAYNARSLVAEPAPVLTMEQLNAIAHGPLTRAEAEFVTGAIKVASGKFDLAAGKMRLGESVLIAQAAALLDAVVEAKPPALGKNPTAAEKAERKEFLAAQQELRDFKARHGDLVNGKTMMGTW